jgi:hypothetical protein
MAGSQSLRLVVPDTGKQPLPGDLRPAPWRTALPVDRDLKGNDGLWLLQQLREMFADVPIIAIATGRGWNRSGPLTAPDRQGRHKPASPQWYRPSPFRIVLFQIYGYDNYVRGGQSPGPAAASLRPRSVADIASAARAQGGTKCEVANIHIGARTILRVISGVRCGEAPAAVPAGPTAKLPTSSRPCMGMASR